MRIHDIIIQRATEDKLASKHGVTRHEVCEVFDNEDEEVYITFAEKGHVEGEDLYRALGRTLAGRYLTVFFIHKLNQDALVISARDMDKGERREHGKAKT